MESGSGGAGHLEVAATHLPLFWLDHQTSQAAAELARGKMATQSPTSPSSTTAPSQERDTQVLGHSFLFSVTTSPTCLCSHMSSIPERQQQRAEFLVALLNTKEAKRVQKQQGITDHNFLKRLSSNLKQYSSIADAPRSGRSRKYTDELLGQARDQLLEGEYYVWSKQAFVDSLIADGILAAGTSIDGFWEAFVPYMQQQGLRLVYGIQRLTFAMSSQHAILRLSWCRQQQSVITTRTVRDCWFTDEITLEHGPHPAGESCPKVQVTTVVFPCL